MISSVRVRFFAARGRRASANGALFAAADLRQLLEFAQKGQIVPLRQHLDELLASSADRRGREIQMERLCQRLETWLAKGDNPPAD